MSLLLSRGGVRLGGHGISGSIPTVVRISGWRKARLRRLRDALLFVLHPATARLSLLKRVAIGGTTTAPRLDDFGLLELCLHQHTMVLTPVKFFAALRTIPLRAIDRKVVTMATSCGVLRTC
jgi:hypothetical protein